LPETLTIFATISGNIRCFCRHSWQNPTVLGDFFPFRADFSVFWA
jgi:hypothetical protein